MSGKRPSVGVLYHFFHPDDVISARIFAEFAADLSRRGWQVTAWPSNRACHDSRLGYPETEEWRGVSIRRLWRPAFRQASGLGRLLNALWMLSAWAVVQVRNRRQAPDILVIGTDPVLSVLVALVVKKLWPRTRIVHWCFDVYPEGAIIDGLLRADSWLVRGLRRLLRSAYAACDLVADLGCCMRRRLEAYGHHSRKVTLVPWALSEPAAVEPIDPATRRELFGDGKLGVLYSGSFGRAHSCDEFLDLARRMRGSNVKFSFGVRGNRADELQAAITPDDCNVTLAGFASEAALSKRLAAADVHMVSLRPAWTGLVVPSKFFGALAAGRPVLFAGSRDTAIARWIDEHKVGWVLDEQSRDAISAELRTLAADPGKLTMLQRHCHQVYREHFSRERIMQDWHRELSGLLDQKV